MKASLTEGGIFIHKHQRTTSLGHILCCLAALLVLCVPSQGQTLNGGMDFGGLGFAPPENGSTQPEQPAAGAAPSMAQDNSDPSLAAIPESVRPYLDIALMQHDLGNYREAEKELRRIIKMEPRLGIPYYYLGLIYEKKLDLKEAVSNYQKALELDPQLDKARGCLENLLNTMLDQVRQELSRDPGFAGSHKELGFIHYVKGELDQARTSLEKAIELDPELAEAYDYLGLVHYRNGDIRKAYQNIEKAFQLDSSDLRIFDDFKMISEKIIESSETFIPSSNSSSEQQGGDQEESQAESSPQSGETATSSQQQPAQTQPSGEEQDLEKLFTQGVADLEAGKTRDAIEKLRAITVRHRDFKSYDEALYALGRAYETAGNAQAALDIFGSLVSKGYRKGESLFRMALILVNDGQFSGAHEVLVRIQEEEKEFLEKNSDKAGWVSRQVWITLIRGSLGSGLVLGLAAGVPCLIFLLLFLLPKLSRSGQKSRLKKATNLSDWNQVIKISRKIMAGKYSETDKFDARLSLARARFELGEFKACIQECKNILKMDGNNKFAQDLMGKSFISEGAVTDEAMSCYRKLFKYDYKNDDLVTVMTRYYVRKAASPAGWRVVQKDLADPGVLSMIKRAARISPEDQEINGLLAEIFMELNQDDMEAMEICESRMEADPSNDRLRKFLVRVCMEKGLHDRCASHARRVLQEEPENIAAHQAFRESFLKRGLKNELLQEYSVLLKMHPDNLKLQDIHNRLTVELSGPVAKPQEKSIQIGDLYGIFKKAGEHLRSGDFDNAITLYKQCVRDSRLRKKASINLVVCYMKKGSVHFAYQLFSKINIDADMTNPHIKGLCYDFARFFEERGEYDKALELYDRICKIDIGFRDVFDRFEEIYRFAGGQAERP